MIRLSRPEDLPQARALWMQAFHDSPEATDFYFAHRNRWQNLLVEVENDQLRGMLTMLPLDLWMAGQALPARYFFAIATDERFRGQGISTRLMAHAEDLARQQGCAAALLVPANAPLFDFYGKRGYATTFHYDRLELTPDLLPPCPDGAQLLPCTAEHMLRLRNAAFGGSRLYARWGLEALTYVERAATVYEAPLLRFEMQGGEGYAYAEWEGEALVIKDLALQNLSVPQALAIVHGQLGAPRYVVRLAEGVGQAALDELEQTAGTGCLVSAPFGMLKPLMPLPQAQGTAPYLSLGKD